MKNFVKTSLKDTNILSGPFCKNIFILFLVNMEKLIAYSSFLSYFSYSYFLSVLTETD